jgi:tetratricopeptide (TPR) repeat protein
MNHISAFIGHSFTEDDADVVRKFLEYFDQIRDMGIGFEWDHARAAEPKELAAKVLSLIKGKNLFIGICTKKERSIAQQMLREGWLRRGTLTGNADGFSWKTSDWIIQEIGLAIGRDMNLILLVERGLRPPGGLQGNIEYIEFDRLVPERSFGRILEMLRALLPKPVASPPGEVRPTAPATESLEPRDLLSNFVTPTPQWAQNDFEFGLFHAIGSGDSTAETAISDAFLASALAASPFAKEAWAARTEYFRIFFGKGGKIERLEALAVEYSKNDEVHASLARAYKVLGEPKKAAECYVSAADLAANPNKTAKHLGTAITAYLEAKEDAEADKIATRLRAMETADPETTNAIVTALRSAADMQDNLDAYFGLSESWLELHPDDTSVRFDLAYKYSQGNRETLSLYHDHRINSSERSTATWNNLGVQYEHFDLHGKSVSAYRTAEEKGETLAMSNLANKLINAGFLREANEICTRALEIENYHKNVASAIAKIKGLPEEEDKKEKALLEKAAAYSTFYRHYGQALRSAATPDLAGEWRGPKCVLAAEIHDGRFVAIGEYEQPKLGNALALALGRGLAPTRSVPQNRRVRYEGNIIGYAIKCVLEDSEVDAPPVTARGLLSAERETEVLMVVSKSVACIRVYERSGPEEGKFYELTKVDSTA